MVSLEQQEKVVFLNSQYHDNTELIHRLQIKLLQDIEELALSDKDYKDTQEYIQDKVTLFRFLKECNFEFNKAHSELLETIVWRLELGIPDLTYKDSIEFYEQEAFAFYHGTDKTGRPLIFVRLRFFPKQFRDPNKKLVDHIRTYACLIMEMGRKLLWDMTCDNKELVSEMTVVVNIQKAPIIPVDAEIIKMIGLILEKRFPGMVSSVNVLNFGWMYQGIWTVVKYLLSEEAKESIRFTTAKELQPLISPDAILQEMGGDCTYQWSFATDKVLEKYGSGRRKEIEKPQELPHTPPLSSDEDYSTRSNSLISEESDEFFDAKDSLPAIPLTPPVPTTAESKLTPILSAPPPPQQNMIIPHITSTTLTSPTSLLSGTTQPNSKSYYGNLSSWVGLRMGVDFLTSFIDTKQKETHQRQKRIHSIELNDNMHEISTRLDDNGNDSSVIIVNSRPPNVAAAASAGAVIVPINNLERIQIYLKQLTHHLLQFTLGHQQRGMAYWILLYIFLRGPVESFVHNSLTRTSLINPPRIKTTTIGITAAVAAIVSSSLSSTIETFRRSIK